MQGDLLRPAGQNWCIVGACEVKNRTKSTHYIRIRLSSQSHLDVKSSSVQCIRNPGSLKGPGCSTALSVSICGPDITVLFKPTKM